MTVMLDADQLLPRSTLQMVDEDGHLVMSPPIKLPHVETLTSLYREMVVAKRFDTQAIALARQGRLAVYASARGQEAAEVGAVLALEPQDWMFPTYRDTIALVTRGIDPVAALGLLRGSWHCGYDPMEHRVAPQCTPLATQALHAVGLADAARRKGDPVVALAFLGDGATSEGDAHEAFNFAGVYRAPCVFLVVNNGYAISVPLSKQTSAPTLAHKAIGYGFPGVRVDGNDVIAVYAAVSEAVHRARTGGGPTLVEAVTYRIEAHTTADDASRYRPSDEAGSWASRDPLVRFEALLESIGLLNDDLRRSTTEHAEAIAADLRARLAGEDDLDPLELFDHVYVDTTPRLLRQRAQLAAELSAAVVEAED